MNYLLMAINILVYVLGYNAATPQGNMRIWAWMLHPDTPQLYQFFSSAFLHANFMHIFGNMVFLWVFGNALNDKLGNVGYLSFYLAGGVLAGVGYLLISAHAPVIGASGAISAVTGAFLVLLPRTRVTVITWLLYVLLPFDVSSLFFLGIQFVFNLWMSLGQLGPASGGVAYAAHAAGYVYGIGAAAALLATGLLGRDPFDLPNLIRSWRRRSRYQRMVAKGYDPFRGRATPNRQPNRRWVATRQRDDQADKPIDQREQALRQEIADACARHDTRTAAAKYLQLVQLAEDVILSRQNQLDVANELMSSEQYPAAADAYERFQKHYGDYEHMGDIHLMLGLLYGRYLHQYPQAVQALEKAVEQLGDEKKVEFARKELDTARRRS